MRLALPYPPSANRYWRVFRGRAVKSSQARAYQATAATKAREQFAGEAFACPVAVRIKVYRPRRSGDLDNALKVVLDALKGICFEDDRQVVELHAWRYDDKVTPRVELDISEAP